MKPHEALRFARSRVRPKLTQDKVAEVFGITRTAVALWETPPPRGTLPDPDKLPRLAEIYGCTIDDLLRGPSDERAGNNVEESGPQYLVARLPLISWVSAGLREEAFDPYAPGSAEDWIEFTGPFSRRAICLRVRGNSMTNPTGAEPTFPDGCYIAVEPDRMPKSGEFAVFRFNNANEATFKQFVEDPPNRPMLVPLAAGYKNIELSDDAHLVGTVTEKRIITRY